MTGDRASIVIVGGGIAGLEALLALRALAGERVDLTLLAGEPEFVYRPMIVAEPFSTEPAERHDLRGIADDVGARFVLGRLTEVAPDAREIRLAGGAALRYDAAIICVGGRSVPAYAGATSLRSWSDPIAIDEALEEAAAHPSKRIAFVVPPGATWPLPAYELALLAQHHAADRELDLQVEIVTPEERPLGVFGVAAADAVAAILNARGVGYTGGASLAEEDGRFVLHPGERELEAGAVVALPRVAGPRIAGLPADKQGFIPIDEHGAVTGTPGVFAAGDGTNFPLKQGGIGTQQADAAAEQIAAQAGADVEPRPFHPVLRGKLIVGAETLSMRTDVGGGSGEGAVSPDRLWWPSQKVGGRYLAPYLAGSLPESGLDSPERALDVEVQLPAKWHVQPLGERP